MDWKKLIADLKEAGWTQAQLAARCECAQSTISDISTGSIVTPSFHIGDTLRTLRKRARRRLDQIRSAKAEAA
jgi:hypothetical protein